MALDRMFGPFRLRASRGIKVRGYLSSTQDAALCSAKGDSPALIEEIEKLPSDGVFIDCGSNCGFYSALTATHLGPKGKVFSIEPSYREFSRLQWARRNNLHECCWAIFFAGAGDTMTLARIDTSVGHTGMNRISSLASGKQHEECPLLTLDFICENYLDEEDTIDLLKIDVEGFETNVLRGLARTLEQRRVKRIFIEITDKFLKQAGSSRDELYALMDAHGYQATRTLDQWQYDEVFVSPEALD